MSQAEPPRARRPWLQRIWASLGVRLALVIGTTIVLGFAVFAYFNIQTTAAFCKGCATDDAEKILLVIERATHNAMLRNHKEEVAEIITNIGQLHDVIGVRIFDKHGRIVFSDRPDEVGTQVSLHAEACNSCHLENAEVISPDPERQARIFSLPGGPRVLGLTHAIENQPVCANAACHAHPAEKTTLGVLDVRVSLARADRRRGEVETLVVVAAVGLSLLAALVVVVFVQTLVRRPVRRLIAGTARVASGDLELRLGDRSPGELGQLSRAFDRMTGQLSDARDQLATAREAIEVRLDQKTDELSRTQRQVVHMEKMASLGKLSATVAHELNNPLAGILNYARLVQRYLAELDDWQDRDEVVRCVTLMGEEAARCGDIVRNLLVFARRTGSSMAEAHLHEVVERALMLVQHQLQIGNVELQKDLAAADDRLTCDLGQLEQALVALLINAVQSMGSGGALVVRSSGDAGHLQIEVGDTGPGIPDEVLPHIFEPFYSTKQEGQGVGLGLAVVYGIVQRHGGEISVDTRLGEGTHFVVRLPRQPPEENDRTMTPVVERLEKGAEDTP